MTSAVQSSPSKPSVRVTGVLNGDFLTNPVTGNPRGEWTIERELQRLAGIYAGLPTTLEQDLLLQQGRHLPLWWLHKSSELLLSACRVARHRGGLQVCYRPVSSF